ncbi:MAG: pilin [Patescibacteria group bacterium]
MQKTIRLVVIITVFALGAISLFVAPVLAVNTNKKCTDAGGTCKYDCDAKTDSYANSNLGCTDSCCIPKGDTCKDHGGSCSSGCGSGYEVAPNAFDCIESCCVPVGTASGIQPSGPGTPKVQTQAFDKTLCTVPGTSFGFPCPLGGGAEKLPQIFGRVIRWVLGLVGALFFAMFVYGGFMYIIAGENAKNAETGQKTLVNAVIGLAIVIGAYMLVEWVIGIFTAGVS